MDVGTAHEPCVCAGHLTAGSIGLTGEFFLPARSLTVDRRFSEEIERTLFQCTDTDMLQADIIFVYCMPSYYQ
ncbi:MAG: hypothetical protein IJ191_02080 [Treponema sp.]|nr:hypothetical protein [Treponema sp.]